MTSRLFFFFLCILASHAANAVEEKNLFQRREIQATTRPELFPKWQSMLSHFQKETIAARHPCQEQEASACKAMRWTDAVKPWLTLERKEQLVAVQHYGNQSPYIEDFINWGISDYWETPREFFLKHGDCEDFAISKFMMLKELGFTNNTMKIVILNDENIKRLHAVLIVNLNGTEWVLDNQIPDPIPATQIYHYAPIYAINETSWWQYF